MAIWKGICTCVACVGAIGLCVGTGFMATPFISAAAAPWVIGGASVGGLILGNQIDNELKEREKELSKNELIRDAMNGVNNQNQENQKNKGLLAELVGKLNGTIPRQPHETDEYLKTQIAVVQKDIKDGEERYNQMLADLNKMRKSLLEENLSLMKILGLDKMKTMDKIILGGGIILIIYLLKS
ncbi:MAG: hypothetical protein LBR43_03645 [Spiroplasmataceae bacterium]|nr:hypothetical protein [Spiroplasmataceae bacterium]